MINKALIANPLLMLSQHKNAASSVQPEGAILDSLGEESAELSFELNLDNLKLSDTVAIEDEEQTQLSAVKSKLGIGALALNELDESALISPAFKAINATDGAESELLSTHTTIQQNLALNPLGLENTSDVITSDTHKTHYFSDTKFAASESSQDLSESAYTTESTEIDNKFTISNNASPNIGEVAPDPLENSIPAIPQAVAGSIYIPQQPIAAHIQTYVPTIETFEEVATNLEFNSEDNPEQQDTNQLTALAEEVSDSSNEYKIAIASTERAEYSNSDFSDSSAEEVILFEEVDGHTNYVSIPTDKASRELASLSDIKFNKLMDSDILSKASNVMEQVKLEVTQAVESKKDVVKFLLNPSNLGELEIKFTTDPITKQLNVSILSERYSTLDMLGNISKEIEAVIQETHTSNADISLNLGLQERSRNFQEMINQHSKSQNETAEYDGATKTYVAAINTYGFTSDGGLNIVV